jgi:hypothetical protein
MKGIVGEPRLDDHGGSVLLAIMGQFMSALDTRSEATSVINSGLARVTSSKVRENPAYALSSRR